MTDEHEEMQENETLNPIPMDFEEPEKRLLIVNTNMEPYRDTMHGVDYEFKPMQVYEVKPEKGRWAVGRARATWAAMKEQARQERREWARRVDSPLQAIRDTALYYCDANGKPRTKPMERPGLVEYESEEGRRFFEEGMAELRKLERDHDLHAPKVSEKPVQHEGLEKTAEEELNMPAEIDEPKMDWDIDQLFGYCQRRGVEVSNLDKTPTKKKLLFNKAMEGFELFKKELEDDGIKYVIRKEVGI